MMRSFTLIFLASVLAGCGQQPITHLGECWTAADFRDQQTVNGSVTILVTLPPATDFDAPTSLSVSPLRCERVSFILEGRFVEKMLEEAAARPAIGRSWDRAFEAKIEGTVRLSSSQREGSHSQGPYRLVVSRMSNLRAIPKPYWGNW